MDAPANPTSVPAVASSDVVIVGSRVAGAATALLLARAGHDVVLVDRTRQPSDTLSTHAIARSGVVQLDRFGVLDDVLATGAPPIRRVSFHAADDVVRRTVKDTAGVDHLIAPRRHALDPVLVDAAVRAGARLIEDVAVTAVTTDADGRADGVETRDRSGRRGHLTARHVVGADGLRSTVARSVGAPVVARRGVSGATHYLYVAGLDAAGIEYHLGGGGFAGVFPTNDGEACVWMSSPGSWVGDGRGLGPDRQVGFLDLLGRVSMGLVDRIWQAQVTSPVRGAIGLPNQLRQGGGPGWWLVGDAGYHRDPITGHGIADALRDAELLAESLHVALTDATAEASARRSYERCRRAAIEPIFDLTCELGAFPDADRFGTLQRRLSGLIEAEASRLRGNVGRPWSMPLAVA